MKKNLLILFLLLVSQITFGQTTEGYLNYATYLTHNGAGWTNQYPQYANSASDFEKMFNTANSNTLLWKQGVGTAATTLVINGAYAGGVPRNDMWGAKITGYFVPKETGTYVFGVDGDDGVDLSIDGIVVASYYGGHGFGGYRTGNVNMVAGKVYTIMARYQNYGGGWGLAVAWKRPSQTTLTLQANEVFSAPPYALTVNMNMNLNSAVDATKFSVNTLLNNNNSWITSASNSKTQLSNTGNVNISGSVDTTKITSGGYTSNIVGGGAEWSYVNLYNNAATLYIDLRQFGNVQPSSVNNVSILDVYSGPVTFLTSDIYWAQYSVPSALTKVTDGSSTNASYIRNTGYGNYAFTCSISFAQGQGYKQHAIQLVPNNQTDLTSLYSSIVTISDVYLAFKEQADKGILGNQSLYFTSGVQFINADIDNNGIFDETDCFRLLQHLTGARQITDSFDISNLVRLYSTADYNSVTKTNWVTKNKPTSNVYPFPLTIGTTNYSYNVAATWKGDVNMSHSTAQTTGTTTNSVNAVRTMSLLSGTNNVLVDFSTELVNGDVIATVKVDPQQILLMGTQFKINFDNDVLKYSGTTYQTINGAINFATDKGSYIDLGALMTGGSTGLSNTTQFILKFTPKNKITSTIGLVSIESIESINKDGLKVNVTID